VAGRIRILPEALQNRIAAGEVVEAPFSVVKELLENAIDAAADEIAVDLKGGGGDLIRLADNGAGMNAEDALAAFDRFATSKLTSDADLSGIATLGFRGEALPSIAAVSRLRLVTCERGSTEGTEVNLVGGEIRDVRPAGRAPGTTIEVSSLFWNTPARRKFLRSDKTELRRIMDLLSEYAILYPGIRLDVSADGNPVLSLLATDAVRDRLSALLGSGVAREMVPIAGGVAAYSVSGFAGRPSIARPRGAFQVLSVNGRPVRSRIIYAAVRAGYGELLPRDRQPSIVLFVEADRRLVDVNVHPMKREVRFGDERAIFAAVETAVRAALLAHEAMPGLAPLPAAPSSEAAQTREEAWEETRLHFPAEVREAAAGAPGRADAGAEGPATAEAPEEPKFWQLHGQYIFVQTREGVLIIDQHAAHERIFYERARARLSGAAEAGSSQQLLFPVVVELAPSEWQTFEEIEPLLARLGFTVRPLSGRTVLLEAVPGAFPRLPHERILQDILADVPSGTPALRDLIESIASTVACRTAIKAGERLREDEMRALVDQLFATELPYSCPHGRPTLMRITTSELDKRFGRT
jgi:DNA mismatch repair protein MutL